MEFIDKAQLILEFTEQEFNNGEYADFFDYNDLGVPMAVALANGFITLTDDGENLMEETWQQLCELFEADPNEEYEFLDDLTG